MIEMCCNQLKCPYSLFYGNPKPLHPGAAILVPEQLYLIRGLCPQKLLMCRITCHTGNRCEYSICFSIVAVVILMDMLINILDCCVFH